MKGIVLLCAFTLLASCTQTQTPASPTESPQVSNSTQSPAPQIGEESMMKDDMMTGSKTDQTQDEVNVTTPDTMSGSDMMKKEETTMIQSSGYIEYDRVKVEQALQAGQKVALFFHATWCPSCRSLDRAINSNLSSIPADTLIVKVDFDTYAELKKTYRVVGQHTTVVLNADGTEKSRKLGASSVAEIFE